VNSNPASTWVAGRNIIFEGATLAQAKVRMGTLENTDPSSFLPYKPPERILDLPEDFDWRTEARGANCPSLKEIRDQANCGSCWAFAAAACMESMWHIKTGATVDLSEQEWVDCDTGNYGCNGGWMNTAFNYAKTNAIAAETDYPYNARDNTCAKGNITGIVNTTGYVNVSRYSPSALQTAVRNVGPVTVAVQAYSQLFMYYSGGIITSGCGTSIDHAITVVGYGNNGSIEYWIAKNSWGTNWGESGYVRILKTNNSDAGQCGVNLYPSYATV